MIFDLDELTIDELEVIEDISGSSMDNLFNGGTPKGKALKAIVYVVNRRTNPDFSLEDAGKLKVSDVTAMFGDDEDPEGND